MKCVIFTYIFFLEPFLPPFDNRLFFPTAIIFCVYWAKKEENRKSFTIKTTVLQK